MDRFRTRVELAPSADRINYHTPCMLMGSCFSDSIGRIMTTHKFQVCLNPFGTLFNPFSLTRNINRLLNPSPYTAKDLRFHDGLWFSLNHYTGFSHPDHDECLVQINRSLHQATEWMAKCDFLLITLGTARVFRFKETGEIVANCHKLPSSAFQVEVADPRQVVSTLTGMLTLLRKCRPGMRVILTLSPVRHLSAGAVANQLSKSILHYSIQQVVQPHAGIYYFPAYEIFMDELRDYRFYASDMLHPSESGTWYVWERFADTWLDEPTKKIWTDVDAVLKAVHHRPIHSESTNHKAFVQKTLKTMESLTRQHPFLDFSHEISLLGL
jgi:hypothetical protein